MRHAFLILMLACSLNGWAQNAPKPDNSAPSRQPVPADKTAPDAAAPTAGKSGQSAEPNLAPPRPDRIDASALSDEAGESSSKDDAVDLSPPDDDARAHPKSTEAVLDAESGADSDVGEFHPWDPHKAAKNVEVGDFYFKQKNYVAAESRYREALYYKNNDAIATFRLAVCLEKMSRPDEAVEQYQKYLKILPYGPESQEAKKALDRLSAPASKSVK